jgi:hypothetical protein
MVSVLVHILGSHNLDIAEDIVQETLLKALQVWPYHPQVALIQRALADLYTIEEKYTKAEQFNKQALANIEKALGPNHPETGESLYKMAEMYYLKKTIIKP